MAEAKSAAVVDKVSSVILLIVGVLVLLGAVRLAIAHWTYIFLVAALLGGAYYVIRKMEQ